MASFDLKPDAPGMLRKEALNITLRLDRTSPNTARIAWNIPSPSAGCTSENQAYSGILIVLDAVPASQSTVPVSGTRYQSDPTANPALFAGDTIGSAHVVGAFYDNRTTTFVDVGDLSPTASYYVSAYPVDAQNRYFREGVHAYSQDALNRGSVATNGTQVIAINRTATPRGVQGSDLTGLAIGIQYVFHVQQGNLYPRTDVMQPQDCIRELPRYEIIIDGTDAQTYAELIAATNHQLTLQTTDAFDSPTPPGVGGYYLNVGASELFTWDGFVHVSTPLIAEPIQPNTPTTGDFWFNPVTLLLSQWDGATWTPVPFLTTNVDPIVPNASYWYDGTQAWAWNGTTWCLRQTTTSTVDPALAGTLPHGTLWLNTTTRQMFVWEMSSETWMSVEYLALATDPHTPSDGTFWLDTSTNTLHTRMLATWTELTQFIISVATPPTVNQHWLHPTTGEFRVWNGVSWVLTPLISFASDPTIPGSCNIWHDTSVDALYVWDTLTNTWTLAATQFIQPIDPSAAPVLIVGQTWFNPTTLVLQVWDGACWHSVDVVLWPTDPNTTIPVGSVWYAPNTTVWSQLQPGNVWTTFNPINAATDPTSPTLGQFWLHSGTMILSMWNGLVWVPVMYSTTPLTPRVGTLWYDTGAFILYEWSGEWTPIQPPIVVELDCNDFIRFTDTTLGELSRVAVLDSSLFEALTGHVEFAPPEAGAEGASSTPTYDVVGIGTDGSDALRSQLANDIRHDFGYPVVDVEVTPEQMDYAISQAIQYFRSRSSHAYKRGFFFMPINTRQQKYQLTGKENGHNSIVEILGMYRLSSAFLSSAHGAGVYGQIVLQNLYNMGTFDLLSFHMMSDYTKLLEMLFASRLTYTWNEQTREVVIHNRFAARERVVAVEAAVERSEQDIMSDRYIRPWIRRYTRATVRMMLAETRGKFSSLPGAGGGISLNASDLRNTARDEFEQCESDIDNYVVSGPDGWGIGSQFTWG